MGTSIGLAQASRWQRLPFQTPLWPWQLCCTLAD
jgi:hypothetical protein